MADEPTEIDVVLLLCDAAQAIGGKLYILGGGWTQVVQAPESPFPMALAIRIVIPWTEANRRIPFRAYLVSHDEEPVDLGGGPIESGGEMEVGRPPGLEPGTPLDAVLAVNAGAVVLEPGRYVWKVDVDEKTRSRAPFRVIDATQMR